MLSRAPNLTRFDRIAHVTAGIALLAWGVGRRSVHQDRTDARPSLPAAAARRGSAGYDIFGKKENRAVKIALKP